MKTITNIHILLTTCAAALALCACSGGGGRTTDSTAANEENAGKHFSTPDLALNFLQGEVENCVITESPALMASGQITKSSDEEGVFIDSIAFSASGIMTAEVSFRRYDGAFLPVVDIELKYGSDGSFLSGSDNSVDLPMEVGIEKNVFGETVEMRVSLPGGDMNSSNAFVQTYTWSDGRLSTVEMHADEIVRKQRFFYDGDSTFPKGSEISSEGMEDILNSTESYAYTEFDSSGNWTKRKVTIVTSGRRYDAESATSENIAAADTTYRIDTRRIRYHR